MHVYGHGRSRIGSQVAPSNVAARDKKVGWWGWGPFVYGLFFLAVGVALLAGGAASSAGGLYLAGGSFVAIGIGAVAVAWYIRRDITSDDGPAVLPGAVSDDDQRILRATGVPGSARVEGFKFLGGSYDGTTVVELQLEVTSARGGTVPITKQTRVPLTATERLAAGATVPVTVSTSDPNDLLFDWSGLTSA